MTKHSSGTDQSRGDEVSSAALEDLFAETRAVAPAVPMDLMARVLADARAVQPRPVRVAEPVWQGVYGALGGWLGWGGLAAAGVLGVMIGWSAPAGLDTGLSAGLSAGLGAGLNALSQGAGTEMVLDPFASFDVSLLLEESGT